MMTILYIVLYFVIGFAVAKIKKCYDEVEDSDVKPDKYYAIVGMLWIPYTIVFCLAIIYNLYKSKL